jgi:DNA repair ATPase RecN
VQVNAQQWRQVRREKEVALRLESRKRDAAEMLAADAVMARDALERRLAAVEKGRVREQRRAELAEKRAEELLSKLHEVKGRLRLKTEAVTDLEQDRHDLLRKLGDATHRLAELEAQDRDAAKLRRRLKAAHQERDEAYRKMRQALALVPTTTILQEAAAVAGGEG